MALERRNPIPPGTYWQDVFAKDQPRWNQWYAKHIGAIHVDSTEAKDGPRNWYKFTLTKSVPRDTFPGFPTIITQKSGEAGKRESAKITASDDTVTKPAASKGAVQALTDFAEKTTQAVAKADPGKVLRVGAYVAGGVVVVLTLALVWRILRGTNARP